MTAVLPRFVDVDLPLKLCASLTSFVKVLRTCWLGRQGPEAERRGTLLALRNSTSGGSDMVVIMVGIVGTVGGTMAALGRCTAAAGDDTSGTSRLLS